MVAKKYGEIHKYGGKIYKKINLIKKFGFRVGLGFENPDRTYILHRVLGFGFSGSGFSLFFGSGSVGSVGFCSPLANMP